MCCSGRGFSPCRLPDRDLHPAVPGFGDLVAGADEGVIFPVVASLGLARAAEPPATPQEGAEPKLAGAEKTEKTKKPPRKAGAKPKAKTTEPSAEAITIESAAAPPPRIPMQQLLAASTRAPSPRDAHSSEDGCDVEMSGVGTVTRDEDLPEAEGGVASS